MRITALNIHTYHPTNDRGGEKNNGRSMTVPDQVLPLATLLARYTRGQSIPSFDTAFDDDEDSLPLRPLSKVEALEALKENAEFIDTLSKNIKRAAKTGETPGYHVPPAPDEEK